MNFTISNFPPFPFCKENEMINQKKNQSSSIKCLFFIGTNWHLACLDFIDSTMLLLVLFYDDEFTGFIMRNNFTIIMK